MSASPDTGAARLPLLAAFAATSVANYAFSLLMARLLLPTGFGVLAFAQTLLLVAGLVLESGVPWSLARALADADVPVAAAVRKAALLNLAVSGLLAAAVVVLYAAGPLRPGLGGWPVPLLLAAALPLIALVGVARGVAQGRRRLRALAAVSAAEVVGKAVCGAALVLLGFGIGGAVAGFAAGALLAALLGAALLRRERGGQRWSARSTRPVPLGVGPMFMALLGGALLLNLDLLLLNVLPGGGARAAGEYQAALVLANAPYFLAASVLVPPLFAALSRADAAPTRVQPVSGFRSAPELARALTLALLLVAPLEYLLALAPRTWLALFFPVGYLQAAAPLSVRAVGTALIIVVTLLSSALQARGHARQAARALFALSAAEVALLLLLVPRLGAFGAACASLGAAAAAVLWLGVLAWRLGLGLPTVSWTARYWLSLLLGTCAFGLSRLLGASALTGTAAALIIFVGAVWALKLGPQPGVLVAPAPAFIPAHQEELRP